MIDTYRAIETPEGVELRLRLAGPAPRALAWLIDATLRLVGYAVASIPMTLLGRVGQGLFFLVLFLGEWFYPVLFEVYAGGATPGKKLVGLAVVHDDGTPVGWSGALLRNLLRFVDFLPVAYGAGLATMLFQPRFKRLGDLAAGTVVVHGEREERALRAVDAPPLPPPLPLDPDEQRAVVAFAERMPLWGPARAAELATLAAPLVDARGQAAVTRLAGVANWLVGRRGGPPG
ncbi:MAG TPA: RDD family protein [Thermoanaerobaculia bacterium]|nr:RDD family protein [Thermoanaerobaculia bacterium]